jgi:hypothetical protein
MSDSYKRNDAILNMLLKGSEQLHYDMCYALEHTNQKQIVHEYLLHNGTGNTNCPKAQPSTSDETSVEIEKEFEKCSVQETSQKPEEACPLKILTDRSADNFSIQISEEEQSEGQQEQNEIPITFSLVLPEFVENIRSKSYSMMYPRLAGKRGRAVIINNMKFEKHPDLFRKGSDVDEKNLFNLFEALMFDVQAFKDRTVKEMMDIFNQERQVPAHNSYEVFVLCVLSHGFNGGIYGTDGQELKIDTMKDFFDGKHCPVLLNKPKLFIIQACQGAFQTTGIHESERECSSPAASRFQDSTVTSGVTVADAKRENTTHEKTDMAEVLSTIQGYESYRNETKGSWFIREMVKVFCKNAHNEDVISMFTQVFEKISEYKTDGGHMQAGSKSDSFTKKLFLLPS